MLQSSQRTFSVLLESSPSAIYRRITAGYKSALEKQGHQILYFEPGQYSGFDHALSQYMATLESQKIDYFLIFDNSPLSNFYLKEFDRFVFERTDAFLIFIHHDNIWSNFAAAELETGKMLLEAWQRVRDRSIHFCLEYSNLIDLRNLGFDRVFPIFHGSEFEQQDSPSQSNHEVSFVGHLLPGIHYGFDRYESLPFSHRIAADFWARLASLEHKIAPSAVTYASQNYAANSPEFVRQRSLYQYIINLLSTSFRGELVKRLNSQFSISLIGGDPGYISGNPESRKIEQKNVSYYAPTVDPAATQNIYAGSKINVNITGIQFDDAVTNRVVDVGLIGGFILTDQRQDLNRLTSVSEAIRYRTIEELNGKIDYYLSHEKERLEVARQLHNDVLNQCTYEKLVEYIFSKLTDMPEQLSSAVYVDLGCDIHKPAGFIGVDIVPAPHVDVVADLNQRFPFPDNSVDVVRARDVIEHLDNRIHTMNEIWRICKPGALVDIWVPSTDGRGAFQDPTHVSFWNINSFRYYAIEFPSYLDLCKRYGFQGAFSILELEDAVDPENEIVHVIAKLRAIKSEDCLAQTLSDRLRLKATNLMVSPDWLQWGEDLHQALSDVILAIASHSNRAETTLLIDRGNFPETEEFNLETLLYELVLNLLLTDGIDVANDGPEISILEHLRPQEYPLLLQQISYRIPLPQENPHLSTVPGWQSLPVWA